MTTPAKRRRPWRLEVRRHGTPDWRVAATYATEAKAECARAERHYGYLAETRVVKHVEFEAES